MAGAPRLLPHGRTSDQHQRRKWGFATPRPRSASGQAGGESEKTSIRTKTALGQLVEDGGFKGGLAPYGYDLVRSGRYNKCKHEVYELVVNESEAAVVRIIFDKYVHEGFGAQRIATYLNKLGYRARSGKMWHHASIRGIICNLTYTGVLRSGDSRSQVLPHLQIITPELFEAAQHIRTSRANSAEQERRVPLNTRGQSLLAGNVFCGHCGSRLSLTTNGKAYPCKDDPNRIVKRVRYVCYGKTRKQTECDGQTGYTAHTLDGIICVLMATYEDNAYNWLKRKGLLEHGNVHLYIHVPRHGLKLGLITLQGLFCKTFGLSGNDEVGKGFFNGCAHY